MKKAVLYFGCLAVVFGVLIGMTFSKKAADEVVKKYMSECKALIFPGEEDFGIYNLVAGFVVFAGVKSCLQNESVLGNPFA